MEGGGGKGGGREGDGEGGEHGRHDERVQPRRRKEGRGGGEEEGRSAGAPQAGIVMVVCLLRVLTDSWAHACTYTRTQAGNETTDTSIAFNLLSSGFLQPLQTGKLK